MVKFSDTWVLVWVTCILICSTVVLVSGQTTKHASNQGGGRGTAFEMRIFVKALPETVVDVHSHAK